MPLQPPNPEFLSQVPDPEPAAGTGPDAEPRAEGPRWHRPAGLAGLAIVVLAAAFGCGELIN